MGQSLCGSQGLQQRSWNWSKKWGWSRRKEAELIPLRSYPEETPALVKQFPAACPAQIWEASDKEVPGKLAGLCFPSSAFLQIPVPLQHSLGLLAPVTFSQLSPLCRFCVSLKWDSPLVCLPEPLGEGTGCKCDE